MNIDKSPIFWIVIIVGAIVGLIFYKPTLNDFMVTIVIMSCIFLFMLPWFMMIVDVSREKG